MFESYTYREGERISPLGILELAIQTACSEVFNSDLQPLVSALLDAHERALELDDIARLETRMLPYAKAEKLYQEVHSSIYKQDEAEGFPESIPYDENRCYPEDLIVTVARVDARRAKSRRSDWYNYYVRETEDAC